MKTKNSLSQHNICILEEHAQLTLDDLCCACSATAEQIIELVDVGVLEPKGIEPAFWNFDGTSLNRARVALRLQRDIGIDLVGAALALELLDEIKLLRARLNTVSIECSELNHTNEENG